MLSNLYKSLNKELPIKLFKKANSLNYILFEYFHEKFIVNKPNSSRLENFKKNGFCKTGISSTEIVKIINERVIKLQESKIPPNHGGKYVFEVPRELRKNLIELIYSDYKVLFQELEEYFNHKITIAEILVKRNFPLGESSYYRNQLRTKDMEPYSNYYHVDFYVNTFFKMFINLQDVEKENGPLHIYNIQSSKNFIKKKRYNNRNDYLPDELDDEVYINTGSKGESLIANTTKCLHRAGVVQKGHRDMLFIIFGLIPNKEISKKKGSTLDYYDEQSSDDVWKNTMMFTKKYKPLNLRSTIKLLYKFYLSKIN